VKQDKDVKISIKRLQEQKRIRRNFKILSARASVGAASTFSKSLIEKSVLMNKQVHHKLQLLPSTGRLYRLEPTPLANSNLYVSEPAAIKVRQNTKMRMQEEMFKAVSIDMFRSD